MGRLSTMVGISTQTERSIIGILPSTTTNLNQRDFEPVKGFVQLILRRQRGQSGKQFCLGNDHLFPFGVLGLLAWPEGWLIPE
jgi:hypothetical protein